ncbi:MAG: hypothetical protein AAGA71_21135 [Pseudomonadota bacterium]
MTSADCFVFTDEGDNERLKNVAAFRTVPVPPALIRAGLLDLVEQRKIENGLTLFQECISKACIDRAEFVQVKPLI